MIEPHVALTQLFGATGEAHHHAFVATNGEDPDWTPTSEEPAT